MIVLVDSSDWPVSNRIWINPVETSRGFADGCTPLWGKSCNSDQGNQFMGHETQELACKR